ncbi:Zinc finger protein ZPR1 [Sarcoptes scabiei]|nr:Zinc finger protein ZPR1 [Sarcoptes scabiei]
MLTEIPFFREVVIMSFDCPQCNYHNNELKPAQTIASKGVRYELKIENQKDLTRQLVKTEWAHLKIPEIEFEIKQQNGLVTTIEGILERAITGLKQTYMVDDENGVVSNDVIGIDVKQNEKIKSFIDEMISLKQGLKKFTFIIEDISGNSFIENFLAPNPDPQLSVSHFIRTIDEDRILGIYENDDDENGDSTIDKENLRQETLRFQTNCSNCNSPCFTNMKVTSIPHFEDIIVMATNCEVCGWRTNEIKPGAGIKPKGIKITIEIKNSKDLDKEVVRSDTCNIFVPELNLSLHSSGSGRYTTVQGLGLNMIEDLLNTNPFFEGDSTREEIREQIENLKSRLQNMIGLTLILDDPCGNTYVEDANKIEHYERTWEQNEEFGLNDMKTDAEQNKEL